jgi:hypothetical protein
VERTRRRCGKPGTRARRCDIILLRCAHRYFTQVAHTALTNASHALEERLARWLLMCHDRADGDDIPMTHELLSLMLNVRRPGVTLAVQALENARLVNARRGVITIVDRSSLEEFAADCYGAGEKIVGEFEGNPAQ